MSTTVARRALAAPRAGATRLAVPADPAAAQERRRRGRLVVAEQVVEKIAAQAAAELSLTAGRSGGVLGIGAETDPHARPKVEVDLSAQSADLAVKIGIVYPGSIRAATDLVRTEVTRRVEELTGVDVRRVDIDVAFLATDPTAARPVVR